MKCYEENFESLNNALKLPIDATSELQFTFCLQ